MASRGGRLQPQLESRRYWCDECGKQIKTLRFHCFHCKDIDICSDCHNALRYHVRQGHRIETTDETTVEEHQGGETTIDEDFRNMRILSGADVDEEYDEEADHDWHDAANSDDDDDEMIDVGMENVQKPPTLRKAPVHKTELREQIEILSSRTPRFLYRGWRTLSGGQIGLNTTDAITPLRFSRKGAPKSIHDIDRKTLTYLASGHLQSEYVDTVFSSWSQSMTLALSFAGAVGVDGYLSIIDTKRLPEDNVILYTPAMRIIASTITKYTYEYLAFGVISGTAHKAVKLSDLAKEGFDYHGLADFSDRTIETVGIDETINKAVRIGRKFGGDFALPVTAHLLSIGGCGTHCKQTMDTLVNFHVPYDWCKDPTIMVFEEMAVGWKDAAGALALLRALVERKHGRGADRLVKKKRDEQLEKYVKEKPAKKVGAIVKSGRMPREVKRLLITMTGWDWNSLGLGKDGRAIYQS